MLLTNGKLSSVYSFSKDTHHEQKIRQRQLSEINCKTLELHEGGHWKHRYTSDVNASLHSSNSMNKSLQNMYFPSEINWMAGHNWPADKWTECHWFTHGISLMYQSNMGNQCGKCQLKGFQPSLSTWVSAVDNASKSLFDDTQSKRQLQSTSRNKKKEDVEVLSPTLRLIERLATSKHHKTLCILGDSIDFQFYDALRHNLMRQQTLQSIINITLSDKKVVPVNYNNGADGIGQPP